jgi:hypothetical protein
MGGQIHDRWRVPLKITNSIPSEECKVLSQLGVRRSFQKPAMDRFEQATQSCQEAIICPKESKPGFVFRKVQVETQD